MPADTGYSRRLLIPLQNKSRNATTMIRVNLIDGLGVLQTEGYIVVPPDDVHKLLTSAQTP